jgi:hypothetical protein
MKRKASKRELIAPRGSKRYIRRDPHGRIKESDDLGRSLALDRRHKAGTAAKPGQGDRGDRGCRAPRPGSGDPKFGMYAAWWTCGVQ